MPEVLIDLDPKLLKLNELAKAPTVHDPRGGTMKYLSRRRAPYFSELRVKLKSFNLNTGTAVFKKYTSEKVEFFNVRSPYFESELEKWAAHNK